MIALVRVVTSIIRHFIYDVWLPRRPDHLTLTRQMNSLMPIISLVVWVLGLILLLDNLGVRITAVIAGLGIGGVAVALAAQTVLADLFSYVAIMLDKPFEIDDFIIVGNDFMGTIEYIGIKTTRVRSLGGEQVIFSNKDLTESRIRNYKRMNLRRIVFQLGLTYDTSTEKLQKAIHIVRETIEKIPDTRFDRAHFSSFGDFKLVVEVVYFVLSADFNKYMDIQQTLNYRIKDEFDKLGVEFAFPTQTIMTASPSSHSNGQSTSTAGSSPFK
jgi:small-conductance mechanosensitive channel